MILDFEFAPVYQIDDRAKLIADVESYVARQTQWTPVSYWDPVTETATGTMQQLLSSIAFNIYWTKDWKRASILNSHSVALVWGGFPFTNALMALLPKEDQAMMDRYKKYWYMEDLYPSRTFIIGEYKAPEVWDMVEKTALSLYKVNTDNKEYPQIKDELLNAVREILPSISDWRKLTPEDVTVE